jgi:polyphosphate kinase
VHAAADSGADSAPLPSAGELAPALVDRDLSWLEFNRRVLNEALDERTPLLERVKFLAIFSSNLDEFFMKRIALIRPMQGESSVAAEESRERLALVRKVVTSLLAEQRRCFREVLRPRLAEHGIHLVTWVDLSEEQREEASRVFDTQISPVLTPLSLDAAHPFPYVSNLSTSWAFRLGDPVTGASVLVRVKVPRELPQWLRLRAGVSASERVFVGLEQVIAANAPKLFRGMVIESGSLFRVCRDAEVELDDDDGVSKRALVELELRQRRFEPVVRLELQPKADSAMVSELRARFALAAEDIYEMSELLDYTTLFEIAGLEIEELRDPPWTPLPPTGLEAADGDIFAAIRNADILLHQPYDSFYAGVERFIREAADDPLTVSIKMTVYRVGDDTPFVQSLIRAAEDGKQVACVIELNARFDEERNLHWSRELEKVGAHVGFGVSGLKTHSYRARRASGGGRHPLLRAHRDGQLPHTHRAAIRGRRAAYCQPGDHERRGHALPLPHRPLADTLVPDAPGRTAKHALGVREARRTRDRKPRRGGPGPDRLQDEPARGPRDVRAPVAGLTDGRAGRPCRSRPLPARTGCARADGRDPDPFDRRAVPRAFPHLPLRRRIRGSA